MKKPYRILLLAVFLTGFVFSAGILAMTYSTFLPLEGIMVWQSFYPWLNAAFSGYITALSLCFLVLMLTVLFWPVETRDLILKKDKGRLLFSKQTVESTVRYSFADVEGINFCKVRAKLGGQPEKTQVYVKLSVSDPANLAGLTQTVQDRIDASLKSSLCITAQSIDIRVVESVPASTARKEAAGDMALAKPAVKSGRVE